MERPDAGLSVEFLGLPGAGKSGVSKRAAELIRDAGIPVVETAFDLTHKSGVLARRWRKAAYVAREILLHPRYSSRSVRAIVATRQRTASDLFGAVWNWLFVSNLLRRGRHVPGVHMLDEGIFQALWSVGFGASVEGLSSVTGGAGPLLPVPDVVVIVSARPSTVEQRLRSRGVRQSRLEDRLGVDRRILERSEALLEEVRGILKGLVRAGRNVAIHELGNDREQDLEPNARALASVVISMFESRP